LSRPHSPMLCCGHDEKECVFKIHFRDYISVLREGEAPAEPRWNVSRDLRVSVRH